MNLEISGNTAMIHPNSNSKEQVTFVPFSNIEPLYLCWSDCLAIKKWLCLFGLKNNNVGYNISRHTLGPEAAPCRSPPPTSSPSPGDSTSPDWPRLTLPIHLCCSRLTLCPTAVCLPEPLLPYTSISWELSWCWPSPYPKLSPTAPPISFPLIIHQLAEALSPKAQTATTFA